MVPVCFLDLDGVLVDFVAGSLAVHGKSLPPDDVRWDFPSQVGFADDPGAFWAPLGHDFWAGLGWTTEGRAALAAAEDVFGPGNIALMTSPCDTPGSVEGKVAWVRRELPGYSRRLFVGPAKHLAAGPGKVLVDDNDANVATFMACGGFGVVVPRPWNGRRAEAPGGRFDPARLRDDMAAAFRAAGGGAK